MAHSGIKLIIVLTIMREISKSHIHMIYEDNGPYGGEENFGLRIIRSSFKFS